MSLSSAAIDVAGTLLAVALIAFLVHRLMRWARRGSRGAYILGAVLTDVTQGVVVSEAKRGRKSKEGQAGDPPNEE